MLCKVIRTCFWHNRLYEKGELVDVDAKDIPEHFSRVLSTSETLSERIKQQEPTAESVEITEDTKASGTDAAPVETAEEDKAETKPLDKMTNFELRALAKKNGIEFSKNATNTELIAAIRGE